MNFEDQAIDSRDYPLQKSTSCRTCCGGERWRGRDWTPCSKLTLLSSAKHWAAVRRVKMGLSRYADGDAGLAR